MALGNVCLSQGFWLGFYPTSRLKSAKLNKPSARQHPSAIDNYLANEVSLHRVAGPLASPPFPNLHISSFGVISKRDQPGKWRLTVDLSSPSGYSVNDRINPEEFSLQYIKVDQIILMDSKYGSGTLLAKFDVKPAYRNIAVHSDDRFLLGMKWRGKYFVDLVLPFGLRSAPFIFSSVADMVECILMRRHHVAGLLHYLNNFITAGSPNSSRCASNLQTALSICQKLGLPLHPGKCVGPSTWLVILGIELDSVEQYTRLPEEKLAALRELITSWRHRGWCSWAQLESLIGHLHQAAKVVWPGCTFLHRMIDLLCCF